METQNLELQAALHVNYLRDHPERSHDEILLELEKTTGNSALQAFAASVLKGTAVVLGNTTARRVDEVITEIQRLADERIRHIRK